MKPEKLAKIALMARIEHMTTKCNSYAIQNNLAVGTCCACKQSGFVRGHFK